MADLQDVLSEPKKEVTSKETNYSSINDISSENKPSEQTYTKPEETISSSVSDVSFENKPSEQTYTKPEETKPIENIESTITPKPKKKFNLTLIIGIIVLIIVIIYFFVISNTGEPMDSNVDQNFTSDNNANTQIANPASVYCEDNTGTLDIRTDENGGQYGVCVFNNGSECEEWAYMNGECEPTIDIETIACEDLNCYLGSLDNKELRFFDFNYNAEDPLGFGLIIYTQTKYESVAFSDTDVNVITTTLDYSVDYTEEQLQTMLDSGTTEEEIQQYLIELNANNAESIGEKSFCTYTIESIKNQLNEYENGIINIEGTTHLDGHTEGPGYVCDTYEE